MNLDLENKNVLITGASRGIGLAIASSFLAEGAKVCIVSRGSKELFDNEKKLKEKFGKDSVWANKCDCTKNEDLESLKEKIINEWGSLDIVIANVGSGESVPDKLPNNSDWEKTWNINFESALQTTRIFLPILESSQGVLLYVSSIAGIEALGAPTDYSTAKTAVMSLAKNLARKSAPDVRVNVLAPGNIFFENGSWDKKIKKDKKSVNEMISSKVPMKRFGTPEEVGDAAVFLCSDKAKFITGTTLVIDGGQTIGLA